MNEWHIELQTYLPSGQCRVGKVTALETQQIKVSSNQNSPLRSDSKTTLSNGDAITSEGAFDHAFYGRVLVHIHENILRKHHKRKKN